MVKLKLIWSNPKTADETFLWNRYQRAVMRYHNKQTALRKKAMEVALDEFNRLFLG